jgi:cytidyltransferase-like protein
LTITAISTSRKRVMVSGFFDCFHSGHLDYLEQAVRMGDLICVVATDKQILMKKNRVNIPEKERIWLLNTFLRGIGCNVPAVLNTWDTNTKFISEALRHFKPDILFRGYDKTLDRMPCEELEVCKELEITIVHAKNRIGERHSSEMMI